MKVSLLSVTGSIPTLFGFLQPFGELFESAIHAAAKFTTEYKASETADEVDGVCDSANEVIIFPKIFVISQSSFNFLFHFLIRDNENLFLLVFYEFHFAHKDLSGVL